MKRLFAFAVPAAALAAAAGLTLSAPPTESGLIAFAAEGVEATARYRQEGGAWQALPVNSDFRERPDYDRRLKVGLHTDVEVTSGAASVIVDFVAGNDFRHEIYISASTDDPTLMCMGCGKTVSAPLGDGPERLWVYESFNGLSGPIMF